MLVAWMFPGDDDQPATRRDVSSARESMEHKVRGDIAEVRTDMAEGFRETDHKIAEVRTEMAYGFRETDRKIAEVRTDMAEGFRETDQKIADLRTDMMALFTKQTRFLVGLMVLMNGTVLAAVLRLS